MALLYADGILICAENTSSTLRKVSEIYDRIAFAGAGKYNEYDRLRIAGVRHADLKGYSFSREDVDAQSLANAYAQMLGDVFTHEIKPMEVEIVVAELGVDAVRRPAVPHLLRRHGGRRGQGFTVLGGGEADAITERLKETYEPGLPLDAALRASVAALAGPAALAPAELEVGGADPGQRPPGVPAPDRRGGHAALGGEPMVAEPDRGRPEAAEPRPRPRTSGAGRDDRRRRRRGDGPAGLSRRASCRGQHAADSSRRPSSEPTTSSTVRADRRRPQLVARCVGGVEAGLHRRRRRPHRHRRDVATARHDLAGHLQVVLGHQHLHRAHRVGAVHVAAQLPHDALGTEVGGEDAGRQGVGGRRQRHHGADRHPSDRTAHTGTAARW